MEDIFFDGARDAVIEARIRRFESDGANKVDDRLNKLECDFIVLKEKVSRLESGVLAKFPEPKEIRHECSTCGVGYDCHHKYCWNCGNKFE